MSIIIILFAIFFIWLYIKFIKVPKVKSITFVDGGLGTGKSFFTLSLAVRYYKKRHRIYKFKCFIYKMFHQDSSKIEEPLLYSNIELAKVPYVKITLPLMQRNKIRFNYKSILFIDEVSLMVDQMDFKDKEINERLSEFFKLFRHETKGGLCFVNSQSTSDLHYALKYVLNDYFYIHHKIRLPFISLLKVQERVYSSDNNVINNQNIGDVEDNCKFMLVFNKYFKYYDTYCYSIFTDRYKRLKRVKENKPKSNLKTKDLITFKKDTYLIERKNKNEKINSSKYN